MEDKNLNNQNQSVSEEVKAVSVEQATDELHGENLNDRVKTLSPGMTVLKRFFRSKLSVIGLVTLIFLFLFSFAGPVFSQWGENTKDYEVQTEIVNAPAIKYEVDGQTYTAFDISTTKNDYNKKGQLTWSHWLGTDEYGQDIFTRLMYGGRISLTIGFVVIILETIIGVILGGLAGYFGGWVDQLIMRIVDILYCIPSLPIMLIMSTVLDALGIVDISRLYYLMMLLTLLGWSGVARLVRGQILSLREQEFMLAAKCAGLSTSSKIFKHLLPNVLPQLIVSMTLGLGSIILTEATLGYLGLGAPLGTATWGSMIQYAAKYEYLSGYLNFWVPPGICITLAILAFNFVGDGLRDAFDPKMKR
ncbi:MAG: ABC transporter permease [Clostridia bacterium]|nr:ABC transporter permease [Clostridia bacterium]